MTDETELRVLERALATTMAKHIVACKCRPSRDGWRVAKNPSDKDKLVGDALRYLELRGLLERKPDAPHLVRIKETNDE